MIATNGLLLFQPLLLWVGAFFIAFLFYTIFPSMSSSIFIFPKDETERLTETYQLPTNIKFAVSDHLINPDVELSATNDHTGKCICTA